MSLVMTACGSKETKSDSQVAGAVVEETSEVNAEASDNKESVEASEEEKTETAEENDGIAQAIAEETSYTEEADGAKENGDSDAEESTGESAGSTDDQHAELGDIVLPKYTKFRTDDGGTVEHITYPSHDYAKNGEEITKEANIYLPYGYSEDKQYNVLYLMHGIG